MKPRKSDTFTTQLWKSQIVLHITTGH